MKKIIILMFLTTSVVFVSFFHIEKVIAEEDIKVGAVLEKYQPPAEGDCDINVPSQYATIQTAIDAASDGDTVCVSAGTYNENVNILKSIQLSGSGANDTVVNAIYIAGDGNADNVIVEGFLVLSVGDGAGLNDPTTFNIGPFASGIVIRYNKVISGNAELVVRADSGQSNMLIYNNIFEGNNSPVIFKVSGVQGPSYKVDFIKNTFTGTVNPTNQDNGRVLETWATNSLIQGNIFNTTGTITILIASSYPSNLINENNINSIANVKVGTYSGGTLNAENNWWGDNDPSDNVWGDVDFTPFATTPFTVARFPVPSCVLDDWLCGAWGSCSIDSLQNRVCNKIAECENGISSPTTQSCVPECVEDIWECGNWDACSADERQSRVCSKTFDCSLINTAAPAATQSCTYIAPVPSCTSFNYSNWSDCSSSGNQTRSVISKYPSNCEGGELSKTTQSCVYISPCTADTWVCGDWNSCSLSGIQTRSCNKTFDCSSVETAPPVTNQYCEAPNRPAQQVPQNSDAISNQDIIIKATVKLICPLDENRAIQGSGTMIDPSGLILTNQHVVSGTFGCLVGFIDNFNDEPYFGNRQIADIQKISSDEDVAILKLRNPQNKKLTSINIVNNDINFQLGDKVNIYGYPAQFGTNITYTSGDFSGISGSYLKTTAIIEYGNSGGGAYFNDGKFIGIPTAVIKGELNALGYILSINTINAWMGNSSIAYNNSNQNNYSRVSSILENIDLEKLDLLEFVISGIDKDEAEIDDRVIQDSSVTPIVEVEVEVVASVDQKEPAIEKIQDEVKENISDNTNLASINSTKQIATSTEKAKPKSLWARIKSWFIFWK